MKRPDTGSMKKKIALAAVFIGLILSCLTFLFIQGVRNQLWDQSVGTIMESTRQGCNTLTIQLREAYESMETMAESIQELSMEQSEELEEIINDYAQIETGASLYLEYAASMPSDVQVDAEAIKALPKNGQQEGIINPHINSVTGANVFNLFVKIVMWDGTEGYLIKEYEVDQIVDSFSLSFYNDAGFSYVVNTQGDVLIRPPHPNSNKTVQNLFDMLPESQNDPDSLSRFAQALNEQRTGWAVFTYQGEKTVFTYIPLKLQSDWYLISIIPEDVVNAQTEQILKRSLALIASIIVGIFLLLGFYLRHANKANKRLINQANYIGHLYNAIPEGIALIPVEAPYCVRQLNQEGLRLLGYPEESGNDEVKGKLLRDLLCSEDYYRIVKIFKNTTERGQKNVFENRVIKADGSLFWAGGIIEKTLDENGNPILIAAFHDITNSKMEEEAKKREQLQERTTLVGAISNAYPVIISMNLSKDTMNYVYVRPGLMIGLGSQKTYSRLFEDMMQTVHPDSRKEFELRFTPEHLCEALGEKKKEVFLEARQMLTDGNYHWISTQIIYVDNPYSEDKLAILISRRIDEQRYGEEQQRKALQSALDNAKAANKAKSQFLSNMSHDIRTPMNAIVGMTAVAAAHLNDRERVIECLKKISLSSKHLLNLINEVLDMSKIESGKLSLREEPFNFAQQAADAVELIRIQANEKRINLDVQMQMMKNEEVIGDPLRIQQVFINILSNAVKYTPEKGNIHVEVRQESCTHRGYQSYVFRCSDTGIGMSQDFLMRIFQPFERTQDTTSSKIAGTGLGMAITKNLVDLMNGDITVESSQGEGSAFTVTIPLKQQGEQQEDIPEEWLGVRSLVVDDDEQTCRNAAELLKDMGLRVQFVIKGIDAVECVIQAKSTPDSFQLVIVDWKMPDMDGVEVARRIRREIGPEIPVIVLTAYDWAEIESEARDAGVTAFMSKPFYRSKICYLLSELSGERTMEEQIIEEKKADFSNKRILVAEDNEINREIARELIGELGAQTEEACDGEEAVSKVSGSEEGYYDLILMDIQMPKMDGYQATKAIRALKRRDAVNIPIIAMTANAFEDDIRLALRTGMNEHFPKPIDIKAFEKMLNKYLNKN